MNKKLTIDGELADIKFPLRTTCSIYGELVEEAETKNTSVNVAINSVLSKWAKKRKPKKQKS
jgi:hypothetical protein